MKMDVWGWLLAACLAVLVGCSILTVNAYSTLSEYKSLRAADMTTLRQEIADASLTRNDQVRVLVNSQYDQLKQYVDVQIPMKVRDAMSSTSNITINQTANPSMSVAKGM